MCRAISRAGIACSRTAKNGYVMEAALIVRPLGKIEAGPHNRDKSILYCDIEPSAAPRSRRSLDVTGHYARPDIFSLHINRMTFRPLSFETAEIHNAEVRVGSSFRAHDKNFRFTSDFGQSRPPDFCRSGPFPDIAFSRSAAFFRSSC